MIHALFNVASCDQPHQILEASDKVVLGKGE